MNASLSIETLKKRMEVNNNRVSKCMYEDAY